MTIYQPIKEGTITHDYKNIIVDLELLANEARTHNNFFKPVGPKSFDTDVYIANGVRLVGVFRKNDKVIIASANIQAPYNYNSYNINNIHYYEVPVEKETILKHFNLVINEYLVSGL